MSGRDRQQRFYPPKRARLVMSVRVRGGFRGILAAIEAAWLDPEDPNLPEDDRFIPHTASERRAVELRIHRRAKKLAKRDPF